MTTTKQKNNMCNTFALCAMTKINRNANKMGGMAR